MLLLLKKNLAGKILQIRGRAFLNVCQHFHGTLWIHFNCASSFIFTKVRTDNSSYGHFRRMKRFQMLAFAIRYTPVAALIYLSKALVFTSIELGRSVALSLWAKCSALMIFAHLCVFWKIRIVTNRVICIFYRSCWLWWLGFWLVECSTRSLQIIIFYHICGESSYSDRTFWA